MYRPEFTTVCGVTGWIPFTEFYGYSMAYFTRDHCPKAFATKQDCLKYCDYLNYVNYGTEL